MNGLSTQLDPGVIGCKSLDVEATQSQVVAICGVSLFQSMVHHVPGQAIQPAASHLSIWRELSVDGELRTFWVMMTAVATLTEATS